MSISRVKGLVKGITFLVLFPFFHHKSGSQQGYNAKKVILEVYASFVLQFTVSGRSCKHKMDVKPGIGSIFSRLQIRAERTGFYMNAEYTQQQLTFLAL